MKNKNGLTLHAHAKINLYLHVGPRRADGYHSIDTLFQEISLHDTLTFRLAPARISLRVTGGKLSAGPDNLVVRALEMLRQTLSVKAGMRVVLDKKIPMGAGLGGGSSDAAAALLAGWTLWKGPVPKKIPLALFDCAKKLGADVSFFLMGGRARAGGVGEKLMPVKKYAKQHLVLVYPRTHVSTAEAYRWIDQERPVKIKARKNGREKNGLVRWAGPFCKCVVRGE
jgi:4-diphosphocytidyl-2-C-methyl-D-erythritol kinase